MNLHTASEYTCSSGQGSVAKKGQSQIQRRPFEAHSRNSLLSGIFCALLCSLGMPAAFAGNGDVCMVDRYNAVHGTSLDRLNCSANDVSLAIYEMQEGQSSCVSGETIDVRLKGDFESRATTRWDVGVFIAEEGNDPNTTGGACYTDFLHPVSASNTDLDLVGGEGPFYNGELGNDPTDMCGDIQSGAPVSFITGWISIECQDSDGDNIADVNTCTVWANAASDGTVNKPSCQDESDVSADSSPKCTCSAVNIVGLDYAELGQIEVVKDLVPSDDSGLFNLWIDASELAGDIGDGGTTGVSLVGAGTSGQPGEIHTVQETAGTSTSLGSYTSSISCVDRGLSTFDGGPPLTQGGSGPMDVLVEPVDDIVCTITNTNVCESAACADTACAAVSCDPTGAVANCDNVEPFAQGTECRASAGVCDVAEVCDGSGVECPADGFDSVSICRESAGVCDVAEVCNGTGVGCPADDFDSGTECRASAGVCDIAEVCNGTGAGCPADDFDNGSECRASAGVCDIAEVCDGTGANCPADDFASGSECRASAGVCDVAEVCDGTGAGCPADEFDSGTECRAAAGVCDTAEVCDGRAAGCPADSFVSGSECRAASGACDIAEVCDGSNAGCPADVKDSTTVCRDSAGVCDAAETCDGVSNDCPADQLAEAGTVCEPSGTGDVICDPPEVCDGQNADCPGPAEANIAAEGTPCGNQSITACTEPDTCDEAGYCENNNRVCGSVTNSALCEFDMEPTKGTCVGGLADGGACVINDPCQMGGGVCEYDDLAAAYLCTGGSADGQECAIPDEDLCESGGGSCHDGQCAGGAYDGTACCIDGGGVCEQSNQFRLLFSPDVQNWVAYRLDASNPGQTFYNVIYDASGAADSDVTLTVTVPYPYVTVGGMPLHVYDDVDLDGINCYVPGAAILAEPMFITLDDWANGADGVGDYNLHCDQVVAPGGSGFCSFDVFVPNAAIPEGGLLYVNVHLDYGLKGRWVDANPVGTWGGEASAEDRYDRDAYISPWSSSNALVNTATNDGPLGIADCSPYWFEHTDDVNSGVCVGGGDGGQVCDVQADDCADEGVCQAVPLFEDSVENLNLFKKISGIFGRVSCADDGAGFAYHLDLVQPGKGVVASTQAGEDGFYIFDYRHKGKPTTYTVKVYHDATLLSSADLILQGNGWWEVSFTASDCGDEELELWTPSVVYGSGRYKKK